MKLAKLFLAILPAAVAGVRAQEWTEEKLQEAARGFQSDSLLVRLQQIGSLLPDQAKLYSVLVARIHGDHREYLLKVDLLLDDLAADRWQVREEAERALIEIGARARGMIQQRKESPAVLEQAFRCSRILDALEARGLELENQDMNLMRGLVATALYLPGEERLLRALRSALGHTDSTIVQAALRALGKHGGDDEAESVRQMLDWKGGVHRLVACSALARMKGQRAATICQELLQAGSLARVEQAAVFRALHARKDDLARNILVALSKHADPVVVALASLPALTEGGSAAARFTLPDRERSQIVGGFQGMHGESIAIQGAIEKLPVLELPFADCDSVDFPEHAPSPTTSPRVFLNQGSLLAGELLGIDETKIRMKSPWFGDIALDRKEVQGLALDPNLDRLVGASSDYDRVRLRSGDFLDGKIQVVNNAKMKFTRRDGSAMEIETGDIAGILLQRPRTSEADANLYTRFDLVTGERWIGYLGAATGSQVAMHLPGVGSAVLGVDRLTRMEFMVGGGAMWGFTLIVDYADNRVIEADDQGREIFVLEEALGPWDAECLDNGNILLTEYSVSRVREVDRKGNTVWAYENLKSPYDADRLANGNTLIADTYGGRVIEVDPKGEIVWSFDKDIRAFDVDRLSNGNTLIANNLRDSIIEVNPGGEVVWQINNLPGIHDADRLPNGNTLVTLRNKGLVQELDRDGKVVWELTGLSSPGDADRLPNGHTLVAENNRVREFDRRGNEVWSKPMSWAVEVNRY
jgi:hypothetical protein